MSLKSLLKHSYGGIIVKCFIILTNLGFSIAFAAPSNLTLFDLNSGLVDIKAGAYVEGSVQNGGIQPDYFVDPFSDPLRGFLEKARALKDSDLPFWKKIEKINRLVRNKYFSYRDYKNPYYRRLLKQYRDKKEDVPLSQYGVCKAGVCREYALILHLALKEAGIPNFHAYARIDRRGTYSAGEYQVIEDHAFVVVEENGKRFAVDAYYGGFNGYPLEDLLSDEGIQRDEKMAETRRIIQINNFPRIFNPKFEIKSCSQVF